MAHFKSLWHICTNRWNLTLRSWLAVFFILTQSDIRSRRSELSPPTPSLSSPPGQETKSWEGVNRWAIYPSIHKDCNDSLGKNASFFLKGGVRTAIKHETWIPKHQFCVDHDFFFSFFRGARRIEVIYLAEEESGCISPSRVGRHHHGWDGGMFRVLL